MERTVCEAEGYDKELDPNVARRRNELFDLYVRPNFNMVYKLVMVYSYKPENVPENYNEVLINFFRRIETYDPSRSLCTWLHIVTKRMVRKLEEDRVRHDNRNRDREIDFYEDYGDDDSYAQPMPKPSLRADERVSSNCMGLENYRQYYNDDILAVLDMMKPIHRDAIILQEAGYSLKEIADIEYRKGTLKSHNIETVKSRLFLARQFLKKNLTRDGERITDTANTESLHGDCKERVEPDFQIF